MNREPSLDELLAADPADPGCIRTLELLDVYVDIELAGQDPRARFPELAAHLRGCPACRTDYRGLLAAAAGLDG